MAKCINADALKVLKWETLLAKEELNFYPLQKDWTVIIAGAWLGIDVLLFSQKVKKIFAFEPIKSTFSKFCKTLEVNNITNVIPINAGFWSETKEMEFVVLNNSVASGYENIYSNNTVVRKEKCTVFSWDNFVDLYQLEKIDICKIDIEGAEIKFVESMKKCLPKRLMIAGYHITSRYKDLESMILNKNYVFDGYCHEYQGYDGLPGDKHTYCHHLEEKK